MIEKLNKFLRGLSNAEAEELWQWIDSRDYEHVAYHLITELAASHEKVVQKMCGMEVNYDEGEQNVPLH